MWGVRFASNDASARSVKLSDGTEAGFDFPLHEDNDHAYGIWSDGETFYVRRRRRCHDLHLSWRQRRRPALRRRRGDRRRAGRQHGAARRRRPWPGLGRREEGPGVHLRDQQSRVRAGVSRDRVRRRFGHVVRAVRPRGDAQRGQWRRSGRRSLHADRPAELVGAEREHLRRSGLGDDLPGSRERDDLLRGRQKGPRHRFRRHRRQWNGERLRRCRSRGEVVHRGRKARHILLRPPLRDGPPTRFPTRSRFAAPSSTTRPAARRRSRARRGWGGRSPRRSPTCRTTTG